MKARSCLTERRARLCPSYETSESRFCNPAAAANHNARLWSCDADFFSLFYVTNEYPRKSTSYAALNSCRNDETRSEDKFHLEIISYVIP